MRPEILLGLFFFFLNQSCSLVIIFWFSCVSLEVILSFLVRPFRWRGLCPLKILLARHHFSQREKKKKQQKTPQTMLSNMRTSPNSLPPVIAFHSIQSVHLSACLQVTLLVHMCPSLQRFSLCFIFSLSLNKRAVVVRSIWCTVDSFRQLMH